MTPCAFETHRSVERVARDSYGRLVALLAARSHDLSAAEDALGDAMAKALARWSIEGIPDNPEAWLLTVARRKLIDQSRERKHREAALNLLATGVRQAVRATACCQSFPDERIKLFFVCAHPAIDPAIRTPLMLQTVLGLNAATIASAFLVTPATMGQRLVRAKAKIYGARIGFQVPDAEELPQRLSAVLETIYAAFTLGWDVLDDGTASPGQLTNEAIWLARIVNTLLPDAAEARGLLSLMLFCESRRMARRDAKGNYVPLSDQDTNLWSESMIVEAEQLLHEAAALKQIGHFQIEASIQSAHVERRHAGAVNWRAITNLYDALSTCSPTIGAAVGRAAAVAEAVSADAGLRDLDAIDGARVISYQPYWALRAHLLHRLDRFTDSRAAYLRAIGLTENESQRRFLQMQATRLAE